LLETSAGLDQIEMHLLLLEGGDKDDSPLDRSPAGGIEFRQVDPTVNHSTQIRRFVTALLTKVLDVEPGDSHDERAGSQSVPKVVPAAAPQVEGMHGARNGHVDKPS
jgi:hypothetical protein